MSSTHATTTERTDTPQPATSDADSPLSPEAVGDAVSAFVTELTDALAAAEVPTATIDAVADSGATLADQVATAIESAHKHPTDTQSTDTARIETLESRIEELETALEDERATRAKEAAEDRKRLHELETRIEADSESDDTDTPTADTTDDTPKSEQHVPAETPLEDVIQIPEHLTESNLTANQRRARFVAKDIHEYTQRVPAGRAIKSSELRRVLAAGEDARIYTETVSRVIEFLEQLGGEAVEVQESKDGQRVVVFTEAIVERIRTHNQHTGGNAVVTHEEVAR